jgi:hypothetical protein
VTVLSPYRTPSPPVRSSASSELVYRTRHPGGDGGVTVAVVRLWVVAALIAMVAIVEGAPAIGGLIVGLVVVHCVRRVQRASDARVVVLRVEGGVLDVTARGPSGTLLRERIERIANVELDTKAIRKLLEANALDPATRIIDSKVGPELDVTRIVFEVEGHAGPIRLSETYCAHMEGVYWLGKIRSFLRSHGWIPEDERPDDDLA